MTLKIFEIGTHKAVMIETRHHLVILFHHFVWPVVVRGVVHQRFETQELPVVAPIRAVTSKMSPFATLVALNLGHVSFRFSPRRAFPAAPRPAASPPEPSPAATRPAALPLLELTELLEHQQLVLIIHGGGGGGVIFDLFFFSL